MDFKIKIYNVLKDICNGHSKWMPLHAPEFIGNEKKYVTECIDSNFVSSIGVFVNRFEEMLVEVTGAKYAVVCVNGTAALHICLIIAGVEQNDEVLIPSLTFVATANAVKYIGAVPHFVDSNERSLGIDPDKLAIYLQKTAEVKGGCCYNRITGARIRAIIPVHIFGHPVDMDALNDVCGKYNITVIEDAAESLGSYYKGKHTGNFGKVSALSFNGNKIITTGGGGAILTNDEKYARLAKHLTTTAKAQHAWAFYHDMVGYNYRMPAINAALGCAQLEMIPKFIEKKRLLAEIYQDAFRNFQEVRFFTEPQYAKSNYWLNALILDEKYAASRNDILKVTNENGIMTRPVWTLLHKLPMYAGCPRMNLDCAESLENRIINIPSSSWLIS